MVAKADLDFIQKSVAELKVSHVISAGTDLESKTKLIENNMMESIVVNLNRGKEISKGDFPEYSDTCLNFPLESLPQAEVKDTPMQTYQRQSLETSLLDMRTTGFRDSYQKLDILQDKISSEESPYKVFGDDIKNIKAMLEAVYQMVNPQEAVKTQIEPVQPQSKMPIMMLSSLPSKEPIQSTNTKSLHISTESIQKETQNPEVTSRVFYPQNMIQPSISPSGSKAIKARNFGSEMTQKAKPTSHCFSCQQDPKPEESLPPAKDQQTSTDMVTFRQPQEGVQEPSKSQPIQAGKDILHSFSPEECRAPSPGPLPQPAEKLIKEIVIFEVVDKFFKNSVKASKILAKCLPRESQEKARHIVTNKLKDTFTYRNTLKKKELSAEGVQKLFNKEYASLSQFYESLDQAISS